MPKPMIQTPYSHPQENEKTSKDLLRELTKGKSKKQKSKPIYNQAIEEENSDVDSDDDHKYKLGSAVNKNPSSNLDN